MMMDGVDLCIDLDLWVMDFRARACVLVRFRPVL